MENRMIPSFRLPLMRPFPLWPLAGAAPERHEPAVARIRFPRRTIAMRMKRNEHEIDFRDQVHVGYRRSDGLDRRNTAEPVPRFTNSPRKVSGECTLGKAPLFLFSAHGNRGLPETGGCRKSVK
jgi:hypothetical protein